MTVTASDGGISTVVFRQLPKIFGILAVALLAIAAKPVPHQSGGSVKDRYLSPIEMVISPEGHQLYVVCQDSDEVRVVDMESGKVVGSVRVGHIPRGIAMSPDAQRLYVTNAWSDTVSVIDAARLEVVQTLHTGFEPTGVVIDKSGTTLYVANRLSSDISEWRVSVYLPDGERAIWRFRRTGSGFIAPTFIPTLGQIVRSRVLRSRL